jgi:FtsP/CotA-like multicopper oxidase with cupredoxin domain
MKKLLLAALALTVTVVVGVMVGVVAFYARADVSTVGEVTFSERLRIPPLMEPRPDASGRKVFDLTLQQGRTELVPGKPTETWGANGPYLGPTLRASRGDRVLMRVRNALPEATTLHWHGMHLPPEADGGPHQMIEPGQRWEPGWTVDQPATTLWYHPHLHGDT